MKKTYLLAGLGAGIIALTAVSAVYAADNNFSAWRNMMGDRGGRVTNVVTEKNFDQFTQMHQLMADGKYDEAQKLRTDLGLGQGRGQRNGGGQGMHRGGAGRGVNFVDANNNGICDRMEQPIK